MPANVGAPAEVPPIAARVLLKFVSALLARKPFAQLVTDEVVLL